MQRMFVYDIQLDRFVLDRKKQEMRGRIMEIIAQDEKGGLKRLELFPKAGILSETRLRGWSLVLETLKDRKYAQLLRSNTHTGLTGLDFGQTLVKTSFAKRRIGCCTFSKKDWKTIMAARRLRMR